jgi:hypothetical protein
MAELASLERQDFFGEQNAANNNPHQHDEPGPLSVVMKDTVKRRKASRRFPSKTLGLKLPQFRISTGIDSPLLDQCMELAHVLRQSFERQAKAGELAQEDRAGRYAQYAEKPGLGIWDSSNRGRASMLESAQWMARTLTNQSV